MGGDGVAAYEDNGGSDGIAGNGRREPCRERLGTVAFYIIYKSAG